MLDSETENHTVGASTPDAETPPGHTGGRIGRLAILGGIATTALAAALVAAGPAAAYTVWGGVNVQTYCQNNFHLNAALVPPGNAYSWRCYDAGNQIWIGVNMNLACHQQTVGHPDANAIALDGNNPYSWRCVTG